MNNLVVTTSSSLENWEITRYLGVVTSHVVAGTNIFSDAFASFSDIFGGRSKSYQKQIASINNQALELLKEKAKRKGGNAIVALKIDHDEISGGGKSMFMVTVSGTAVKANLPENGNGLNAENDDKEIDAKQMSELIKVHKAVTKMNHKKQEGKGIYFRDDEWKLILKYKELDVIPLLFYRFFQKIPDHMEGEWKNKFIEFFGMLDTDLANKYLYNEILKTESNTLENIILYAINKLSLVDFDRVEALIRNDNFNKKKLGIQLLACDKLSYQSSDIQKIQKLMNLIDKEFSKQAEIVEVSKTFSSKTKKCGNVDVALKMI